MVAFRSLPRGFFIALPIVVKFGMGEVIAVSIKKLESDLESIVEDFKKEIKFNRETSEVSATRDDIEELGRQTYYTLDRFKTAILEHLRKQ